MNEEELRQQAADLLLTVHLSMNWEVWGPKRLKYWDAFQENVAAAAYTDNLARWLNTLCARMSVLAPGRNEAHRERLEAILNSGQDRALLKLLREETQLLVLMVRVSQQAKKEEAAAREAPSGELEAEGTETPSALFTQEAII